MTKHYRAELTGVFGDPVDDNPTGVMEEAAYAALGLNYRYITARVAPGDLDDAMRGMRALGFRGVNLTMPHKIAVIPLLDELSEAARIIGAVNTVVARDDGTLLGENTDGKGFVDALAARGIPPEGRRILLLGAGGAARAIGVECALAGAARLTVVNRTGAKAEELASLITRETGVEAEGLEWTPCFAVPDGSDLLVNATSIGFAPNAHDAPDLDYSSISPSLVACDVVFEPRDTLFLRRCRERGASTIDGLGMLARQGARNFTLWTGVDAPFDVLEAALAREFKEE